MPSALLALIALVNPTLRAVREQAYQVQRPFVVDHAKFGGAFGTSVTPHREAISLTFRMVPGTCVRRVRRRVDAGSARARRRATPCRDRPRAARSGGPWLPFLESMPEGKSRPRGR